ncbi:MAG: LysR family transcriptional regulator [Solirubrobacteraceae bacterium]|jgi:DNA-binding transcriptional LysR family regulator
MLDVKQLRVLKEVAERGSFSSAAIALSYTQPAISQQIAALERQAGAKLVDRTSRGVRLTDAGRALVGHADAILARLADAEAELEAIRELRGGQIRLSSFPTGGASLIPVATAAFRRANPGVDISLSVEVMPSAVDRVKAGEVDIALLVESGFGPPGRDALLERVHLLDDPMFAVLPAGHRLAGKRTLRLTELAGETWMHGGPSCCDAAVFLRACHDAGFEPRLAFENDDYSAIQGFIAAGVGIALIPQLALHGVRDDVVVRALAGRPPIRRVVATTLSRDMRSLAAEAMLAILVEISADYLTKNQPPLAAAA